MSALAVVSPIIIIFILAMLATLKEYIDKRYPLQDEDAPDNNGCTTDEFGKHRWQRSYNGWNSGLYHQGAIGRSGHRCFECGEMVHSDTDDEFINKMPAWLLQSPECSIPSRFLQYISKEVLDKRQENIDTKKVEDLQRSIKRHQESESACVDELLELELA